MLENNLKTISEYYNMCYIFKHFTIARKKGYLNDFQSNHYYSIMTNTIMKC